MVFSTSQQIHQHDMTKQQLRSNVTYVTSRNMRICSKAISRFVFQFIGCLLQLLE